MGVKITNKKSNITFNNFERDIFIELEVKYKKRNLFYKVNLKASLNAKNMKELSLYKDKIAAYENLYNVCISEKYDPLYLYTKTKFCTKDENVNSSVLKEETINYLNFENSNFHSKTITNLNDILENNIIGELESLNDKTSRLKYLEKKINKIKIKIMIFLKQEDIKIESKKILVEIYKYHIENESWYLLDSSEVEIENKSYLNLSMKKKITESQIETIDDYEEKITKEININFENRVLKTIKKQLIKLTDLYSVAQF